jgi:uncharacterized integral membrane protein
METARLVITLILIGLLIIFTLQNTESIGVDVLLWDIEASGAIFVFMLFAAGIVVGWVLRSLREPEGFNLFGIRRRGEGGGADELPS